MKVLLIKDVYKLGRAGDIKRVADGYGRNFLLPKGLAVLATAEALKKVEAIRSEAAVQRQALNSEMSGVAEILAGKVFAFASKAGETGKLYGSITTQMIADAIQAKLDIKVDRHQIEVSPIRMLGEHKAHIRLTVDLVPEITVIVHREGEVLAVEKAPQAAPVVEPIAEVVPPEEPATEAAQAEEPAAEAAQAEEPAAEASEATNE
ncbi:MAG: 50S ribosomal protein L9 [Bellilinea sp.]